MSCDQTDVVEQEDFLGPFLAGSVAGMAGNLVGQPWDTVKVRMQSSSSSATSFEHARRLVQEGGIRALYRGTVPPLLAAAPTNAATFGGYEAALKLMGVKKAGASPQQLYFAGCAGGAAMSFVLTPLDLVKCKLQASSSRVYSGPLDCVQKVVRANGVRGLYTGFSSTFIREAPSFGIYFLLYEFAFRVLNPQGESSTSFRGAAASCFAGASVLLHEPEAGSALALCEFAPTPSPVFAFLYCLCICSLSTA